MTTISGLIEQNNFLRCIDADTGEEYQYGDLCAEGFEHGDKKLAFLYLDNGIASVSAMLTVLKSDHCLALMSNQLHPDLKATLEEAYKPAIIVDSTRVGVDGYDLASSAKFSYFIAQQVSEYPVAPELKMLLSTSGTTGSPKFVKLSETNIVENARSISAYLPINHADVAPLNLPLYYSYGFSVFSTNSINGGKLVCGVKDIMNKGFWAELDKYGFTSISGVPFLYEMLNRLGFTKKIYPSLRYLTQAGGKLNDKLIEVFNNYALDKGISFFVMYGQTEATARMSYMPAEKLASKIGSIGKAIPNGRFYIDTETSELLYSGPNVFGGYASDLKDLAEYEKNEVLHTGDMARVDDEGFYYITGRIKRMVKIFGNRVNLDEVEHLLKNQFPQCSFACVGVNDQYLLTAYNGAVMDEEQITDYLSGHLNVHYSAFKLMYLEDIPLTSNGKVNYTAIKNQYESV